MYYVISSPVGTVSCNKVSIIGWEEQGMQRQGATLVLALAYLHRRLPRSQLQIEPLSESKSNVIAITITIAIAIAIAISITVAAVCPELM
jgi:hypothetical protein